MNKSVSSKLGRAQPMSALSSRVGTLLVLAVLVMSAGCLRDKPMSIEERWLLDARHDYLRCEVYLDRLRDLYNVSDTEKDGLMDESLKPALGSLGSGTIGGFDGPLTGGHDGPLTGGHDGPLTGGHDGPLTGGHDGPLTGGHDLAPGILEATKEAREQCWDAVQRLVTTYDSCVKDYVERKDCGGEGGPTCYQAYETCLQNMRAQKLAGD